MLKQEALLTELLERVLIRKSMERVLETRKDLLQQLADSDYDTGFNCVHGMAFDCDPCMARLSKKQRADAAEISRLKADLAVAEARGFESGLDAAASCAKEWADLEEECTCADAILEMKRG